MGRIFAMFVIGLGLGGGFGFLVAASNGVMLEGHDHGAHGHGGEAASHAHHHEASIDAPADSAPTLAVRLLEDPVAGWNLNVITENFHFSPEQAGHAHVPNEGHAHVYVNGEKIARLYGAWMHIGALPEGAEVEVTLNANDHSLLSVEGQPLSVITSISATH